MISTRLVKLNERRKAAGLSTTQTAEYLGIVMADYNLKEEGFHPFTREEKEALAKLLNLTESEKIEIFGENP